MGFRAGPGWREPSSRRLLPAVSALSLIVVTMLGISRLWDPPGGDQALFLLGASVLHSGGMLYRDFWDLKQPGIFEFYLAAGIPFGFTSVAALILGLGLWLVLSIAQIAALAPLLRRPALAAVAPLVTAVPGRGTLATRDLVFLQARNEVKPSLCPERKASDNRRASRRRGVVASRKHPHGGLRSRKRRHPGVQRKPNPSSDAREYRRASSFA